MLGGQNYYNAYSEIWFVTHNQVCKNWHLWLIEEMKEWRKEMGEGQIALFSTPKSAPLNWDTELLDMQYLKFYFSKLTVSLKYTFHDNKW